MPVSHHGDASQAAAKQSSQHTAHDPFLAEMQRLLQALVESEFAAALVFWPLTSRSSHLSPLPTLLRAALKVRQPPPRTCFGI